MAAWKRQALLIPIKITIKTTTIMLQSDKISLHYRVISNMAHKVEKVAKELSAAYNASYFNEKETNLKKEHLKKYMKELEELMNNNEN